MKWIDVGALGLACFAMGIERFRPWDLANPDATFALGVGLAATPIARLMGKALKLPS